jgi:MFS family permease
MTTDAPRRADASPPRSEPGPLPPALAEPTVRVRRGWVILLVLANLGLWMAFFTPIQILLPQQIEQIAPAGKEAMLGWVTGLGALAAVIANPLAGALSDRTSPRLLGRALGRRHPWTLGGALLGGAALVLLANQHTIIGVAVGWVLAQMCLNAVLATLSAAVPDRVPVDQRGAVSGWVGMPQAAGLVLGGILVTTLVTGVTAGYLVIAVAMVALTVPFALSTEDHPLPREHRPPLRTLVAALWVSPRRHPDFAWAFGTRFAVQLGNALGTLYLLYFLADAVKVERPEDGVVFLIVVYAAALIATAVVAGVISDRTGKRKIFVIVSGIIMTVAALLLAIWPTWPAAVAAAATLGAGYGIYLAVDSALITQVLPTAAARAKDLGIINIANSAPQVLGPAIAAPIVVYLGGYPVLYAVTAAITLLGGVLVFKIRSVP